MHYRPYKITLLLLYSPNGDNNYHYVWVKNISQFVASGYTRNHAYYVCLSCLHPFYMQSALDKHKVQWLMHRPQQCSYPDTNNALLCYGHINMSFPFHFILCRTLNASSNPKPTARWYIALRFLHILCQPVSIVPHRAVYLLWQRCHGTILRACFSGSKRH